MSSDKTVNGNRVVKKKTVIRKKPTKLERLAASTQPKRECRFKSTHKNPFISNRFRGEEAYRNTAESLKDIKVRMRDYLNMTAPSFNGMHVRSWRPALARRNPGEAINVFSDEEVEEIRARNIKEAKIANRGVRSRQRNAQFLASIPSDDDEETKEWLEATKHKKTRVKSKITWSDELFDFNYAKPGTSSDWNDGMSSQNNLKTKKKVCESSKSSNGNINKGMRAQNKLKIKAKNAVNCGSSKSLNGNINKGKSAQNKPKIKAKNTVNCESSKSLNGDINKGMSAQNKLKIKTKKMVSRKSTKSLNEDIKGKSAKNKKKIKSKNTVDIGSSKSLNGNINKGMSAENKLEIKAKDTVSSKSLNGDINEGMSAQNKLEIKTKDTVNSGSSKPLNGDINEGMSAENKLEIETKNTVNCESSESSNGNADKGMGSQDELKMEKKSEISFGSNDKNSANDKNEVNKVEDGNNQAEKDCPNPNQSILLSLLTTSSSERPKRGYLSSQNYVESSSVVGQTKMAGISKRSVYPFHQLDAGIPVKSDSIVKSVPVGSNNDQLYVDNEFNSYRHILGDRALMVSLTRLPADNSLNTRKESFLRSNLAKYNGCNEIQEEVVLIPGEQVIDNRVLRVHERNLSCNDIQELQK